ncbi:MAG: PQQ-binding-like beta-propeller repeat protein [Burkholderiaceae bacterium]|nr:PQQ-binding-like beta-propeller repeat protein [Burkholderiaceae bacterium]
MQEIDGIEVELTREVDYTVTLNEDQNFLPGGVVTMTTAPDIGVTLFILGNVAYTQELSLPSGGNFSPEALELQLDRMVMQIQQLKERTDRSVIVPLSTDPLVFFHAVLTVADNISAIVEAANAFRSQVGRGSLIASGQVRELWSYRVPGKEPNYSSPIGPVRVLGPGSTPADAIVFQSWDWFIYALDVNTGALLWRKPFSGPCYGRPQADVLAGQNATLFGNSSAGEVWSIPPDGGAVNWQFFSLYQREGTGTTTSATTTSIVDSTKNWAPNAFLRLAGVGFGASVRINSGPAAGETREIVGRPNGQTLTVSPAFSVSPGAGASYTILPRYSSDVAFQHAGTLVRNESTPGDAFLYITSFDNHTYKLNANTGALIWKFAALENFEPYPLVTKRSGQVRVYTACVDGRLRCLNGANGAVVWETTACGPLDAFLSLSNTDKLVVPSRNSRLYLVNPDTGAVLAESTTMGSWQFSERNSGAASYIRGGKELYFSGGDDGTVYCFDNSLNVVWHRVLAPIMVNATPVLVYLSGEPAIAVPDMRGTIHFLRAFDGANLGYVYVKGGVEGVPLIRDINGDGRLEMVVTTLEGYVVCFQLDATDAIDDAYPGSQASRGFVSL